MKRHGSSLAVVVGIFLAMLILSPLCGAARAQSTVTDLRGQIIDESGLPVARVEVVVRFGSGGSQTVYTDNAGRFESQFTGISQVELSLSKPGFFRVDGRKLSLAAGVNEISLTLNHEIELQERLEVQSEPVQIDPDTTSHQESLVQHEILNTPGRTNHALRQILRTLPQA